MSKILIFIALTCLANASLRDVHRNRRSASFHLANDGAQWSTKLCKNETAARLVVTKLREFLTTLETNGSFTEILQKHSHAIAYIKSDANANTLSSNCTEYFNGLNNARKLDKQAEVHQGKSEENTNRQLKQILQSIVGPRSSFYDDFFK